MRRHAKAVTAATAALLLTLALSATLATAVAPVVTIEDATNVSYRTADVKGTVNPEGQSTTWRFQYITDAQFQENLANSLPGFEGASTGIEEGTETEETLERELTNLQPGTTYHLRLVAENGDGQSEAVATNTFVTKTVGPPSVTIDPVTTFTGTTAKFTGTIDPEAPEEGPGEFPGEFDVSWHFECTPTCSVDSEGGFLDLSGKVAADADPHEIGVDVNGLEPNTNYEVRLIAGNHDGGASDETSFATAAVPPVVETLPPAVITDTSAWIGGRVNPQNSPTTYYVEYSTDPSFATSVKVPAGEDGDAGSGSEFVVANHHAEGLAPETTYHYRVVAMGAGETKGSSEAITTRALPFPGQSGLPQGRVYERVSPTEKNGAQIESYDVHAAEQGDAVSFKSFMTFAGESGSLDSRYIARRQGAGAGWVTEGITPPIEPTVEAGVQTSTEWLSPDLSHALTSTPAALNPGDPPSPARNLYLRDNETGENVTILNPGSLGETNPTTVTGGVSADEKHIVYLYGTDLGQHELWQWAEGAHRAMGIGTMVFGGSKAIPNMVSADGSRVFFYGLQPGDASTGGGGPLGPQLRDFNTVPVTTQPVAASERSGDDPTLNDPGARLWLISPDGSVAYFTSRLALTEDSQPAPTGENLYRWDSSKEPGSRLLDLTAAAGTASGDVLGVLGGSADASVIYFASRAKLTPEARDGAANVYRWVEDEGFTYVASLDRIRDRGAWNGEYKLSISLHGVNIGEARVTPNGRRLLFGSHRMLTSYDTHGASQLYLFDAMSGQLECVSCGAVEDRSQGESYLTSFSDTDAGVGVGGAGLDPGGYLPHNLRPDGSSVVFDSLDALNPQDSNGQIDTYMWKDGQIDLLSTGESGTASRFMDASVDGKDIFFTTREQLVPSDADLDADLYDVRVGGIAEQFPHSPCVADECQGNPSRPPDFSTPSSSTSFNPTEPSRSRCRKGKVRRKGRCVRVQQRKRSKKGAHRRQGRNG